MLSTEEKAQLTEALDEGEQTVAELQQGGSPADASRIMSLRQKVALGTFAKQRLTGDAHASLTGGKPLRAFDSERLFSDAPPLPQLAEHSERVIPERVTTRPAFVGLWRRDGPAAHASRVADAMTRAAHMHTHPWRGLLGKRTREAAELPGKLAEYEGRLSKWQREARRSEEAHIEGGAAAEAEGVGDEGECTICKEPIEGDAGALGCAEGVAGATGCAGRFCATCLPEIRARILAGKLPSCPSCRRSEPPMGQAGAVASLRLCRNFVASSTENAFESIAVMPPPRDESAGEGDAQMATRLQQVEHAAWVRGRRHRQLEESDARDARETVQLQAQLQAQRASADAQREARGAEGGSSTAAERQRREADASALGGGAAGGGASSSPSSPDAASAAPQSAATPPPVTAAPDGAAGLATCPCCHEDMSKLQMVQLACNHAVCGACLLGIRSTYTEQPPRIDLTHDSGTTSDGTLAPPKCPLCRARISETEFAEAEAIVTAPPAASATPGSAAIGGDDMGGDALDSHALPGAGNLNPSPNHAPIP